MTIDCQWAPSGSSSSSSGNHAGLAGMPLAMPKMSGDEVFQELRRIKSDAKVLVSSGFNEQDVTNRFAASGLAGFLQKPYRLESLTRTVRQILDS